MIEHNAFCNSEPQEDALCGCVDNYDLTDWNDIEPPDLEGGDAPHQRSCATDKMGTPMTIGTPTAAGIAAKGSPATDAGILKWNSLSQRHLLSNSRNPGRSGRSFIIIWRTRAATRSRSFKFEADCGGHACRFLLP